jgi:hypothetical protein
MEKYFVKINPISDKLFSKADIAQNGKLYNLWFIPDHFKVIDKNFEKVFEL